MHTGRMYHALTALAISVAFPRVEATDVGLSGLNVRAFHNETSELDSLRYKRDFAAGAGLETRHLHARGTVTNATGGINWKRHQGKSYLRFVLEASVEHPYADSVPMAISIANCEAWKDKKMDDPETIDLYNAAPLVTAELTKDNTQARMCQTFFAQDATPEGPEDFDPRAAHCTGWPVAITISDNDKRDTKIGWNVSEAIPSMSKRIKWIEEIDLSNPSDHLIVDCAGWWYEHEAFLWNKPQYYGRMCRLRIHDATASVEKNARLCITAGSNDLSKLNGTALAYEPCTSNNERQIWHIQSTATEWPHYFGQGKHGYNFDKGPLEAYTCEPHCAKRRS